MSDLEDESRARKLKALRQKAINTLLVALLLGFLLYTIVPDQVRFWSLV